jgi:hypothetical protein
MLKVWVMEGYQPLHNEIAMTKLVPKQRHSRLLKRGAEDGATVPKEISQRSNMFQRFRGWNKFVQNDGYHLPVVDQHGIFMDFLKIINNRIAPLVLPFRGCCNPEAYDLP